MAATSGEGSATGTATAQITTGRTIAWAILFIAFVAMTDFPALASVGAGLAWLFFVSIMLTYGPAAFGNITTLNKG